MRPAERQQLLLAVLGEPVQWSLVAAEGGIMESGPSLT
jgi:hypothetical protein